MYAILFVIATIAVASSQKVSGGAACNKSADCGGSGRGLCEELKVNDTYSIKHCSCFPQYSAPDCSYTLKSRTLLAGLQIGLAFLSINGVGEKLAGYDDLFIAQFLMGISILLILVPICICCCCGVLTMGEVGKGVTGVAVCCLIFIAFVLMISAWAWGISTGVPMLNDPNWKDANGYPLIKRWI